MANCSVLSAGMGLGSYNCSQVKISAVAIVLLFLIYSGYPAITLEALRAQTDISKDQESWFGE
jgi:hypothetical protein